MAIIPKAITPLGPHQQFADSGSALTEMTVQEVFKAGREFETSAQKDFPFNGKVRSGIWVSMDAYTGSACQRRFAVTNSGRR